MSVRKRKWTTRSGEEREAWVVDYLQNGERHIETFARKKDADARHAEVKVDVKSGTHVAPSKSPTLKRGGARVGSRYRQPTGWSAPRSINTASI